MSEPTLILKNMRGNCTNDGSVVHALFRFNGRSRRQIASRSDCAAETIKTVDVAEALQVLAASAD